MEFGFRFSFCLLLEPQTSKINEKRQKINHIMHSHPHTIRSLSHEQEEKMKRENDIITTK